MFKRIGLIALAVVFSANLALAESGYRKPHRKPHYKGGHVERHYHRKHGNNYYKKENNYYYYRGGNRRFYNNPYFWGGVAGGIIGGAIVRDYNYFVPECETIWIEVYIPGEGYRQQQQVVCD